MVSFLRKFLLLAAFAASAAAQPEGTGVVSGIVIDHRTREPIRKAYVTLTWRGTPRAWAAEVTNSSGEFTFSGLPAGSYDLSVHKDRYLATSWNGGAPLVLAANEAKRGVLLELSRLASISGTIRDEDGDPLPGAGVELYVIGQVRGRRDIEHSYSAMTDDHGEYNISVVMPGRYLLAARYQGMGLPGIPMRRSARVFHPGVFEWTKASAVTIASGDSLRGMDLRLNPSPPVTISGRVTGMPAQGEPGASEPVNVIAQARDSGLGASASPPEYRFTIEGLEPGNYWLQAACTACKPVLYARQAIGAGEGDLSNLTLALAPAVALKGTVRGEGEGFAPGQKFTVTLTSGDVPHMQAALTAETDAKGAFVFPEVPPGIWDINATPLPKGGFIKSMLLGRQDVLTEEMEINSATSAPLNIVLSSRGAAITGKLVDENGQALRGAVVLAPAGKLAHVESFYTASGVDLSGKFEIIGITPGEYKVYAFISDNWVDYRNPEFLAGFEDRAQTVKLAEGARLEMTPKPIRIQPEKVQP